MEKLVRYELDPNNLPELTDLQKAELKALAEMPDDQIDYSDIPPLTDAFWENAVKFRDRKTLLQRAAVAPLSAHKKQ